MDEIVVSIICLTYNQEKYIREALEGFLMQKTGFSFEILIHDDASTDGTVNILKEYQERNPKVVRLILEKENQFSKGIDITRDIVLPYAKGKYIAFCEGDDFWIYDRKLQKQYDFMETHPEVSACYHNAIMWSQNDDSIKLSIADQLTGYISDEDIICPAKGWYPTASLFTRAEYKSQPQCIVPTGDEGLRNYLACRGKVYYINRIWSVYREFSKGGWNTRYYADKEFAAQYIKRSMQYFSAFDRYSKGRFEKYIPRRVFMGITKFKNVHYGEYCSVNELKACIDYLKMISEHIFDNIFDMYYSIYVIRCKNYYRTTIEEQMCTGIGLYIYGAGTEAIKALIELDKHQMVPEGFIVSDRADLPQKILGIPVYEADEVIFDENKRIWPCLIEGRETVLDILNRKGCKHIIF